MRIVSSALPGRAAPPVDPRPTPADALQQLLRLEQQSLWTTRRLRTAVLSPALRQPSRP